jgi:hypothetical protein
VKVDKNGTLSFKNLDSGRYVVCAELEEVQHAPHSQPYPIWKYVALSVK